MKRIWVDKEKCLGCKTCELRCAVERDSVSKTMSFAEAVDLLVKAGTERPEAEKIVRQLSGVPGFKEYLVNLNAKGVENLTHFSMLGGFGDDNEKKGGKK